MRPGSRETVSVEVVIGHKPPGSFRGKLLSVRRKKIG